MQLFRENSRSTTAHSEGIKPCGVHRSSQLLWVCLDHELVLSDSAQAPCQPQCHPPGGEADLCHSMDHTGSRMDEPAFLLTAGEPGNCILPLALGAAEAAGGSAAPAGLGEIAIQVWHRQVRLQHLVSCLHESRVGVWELAGHLGVTGWELQFLGHSFGLGVLDRAAESCHRPCRGKRCWVAPLADLLASPDLALPAWLGF